jgi:hypothetical protein
VEKVARLERELHPEAASSQDGTVPTADQTADVLERVEQSVETQQPTLVIPS